MLSSNKPLSYVINYFGYIFRCDDCGFYCHIEDSADENDVDVQHDINLRLEHNIYIYCPRCGQKHANIIDINETYYEDIKDTKKHNKRVADAIAKGKR